MTKVIEQKDGDTIEFIIDGHADKINPDEGNILCAAVSMQMPEWKATPDTSGFCAEWKKMRWKSSICLTSQKPDFCF